MAEFEFEHTTHFGTRIVRHQSSRHIEEVVISARLQRGRILLQAVVIEPIVAKALVEQRVTVVEKRSWGNELVCLAVYEEAEVVEMPVGIANERIEGNHVAERLLIHGSNVLEVVDYSSEAALAHYVCNWNKRLLETRE